MRPEILCDKGGKSVPEILYGHIGKSVDLDCRGKSGHNDGAEAVDQSLHKQNSQIHDRLLDAGQQGKAADFPNAGKAEFQVPAPDPQMGKTKYGKNGDSRAGYILRRHSGPGGAPYAQVKSQYKP